jgi:cysteine desulfurase
MQQRVYLDNAATTPMLPEVLEAMLPYMQDKFGNPSSIYSYGREAKMAIENARKFVAKSFNAKPGEIFFTGSGTESTNMALYGAVINLGVKHIISSKIEHHATLHTIEYLQKQYNLQVSYVPINKQGHLQLDALNELLVNTKVPTLVTLMYANNEIGNLLDIAKVGKMCKQYNAYFHTDAVQAVGHYTIDVQALGIDMMSSTGHKFHGPKGTGVLYLNENIKINPLIWGGAQERNMRAGTENVYGIVGYAKALEIALNNLEKDTAYIRNLKSYCIEQLNKNIELISYTGDVNNGLYTILNAAFANTAAASMLIYNLDIAGICVSGGSACSSGANNISHVIYELRGTEDVIPIRISFSKLSTEQDIDKALEVIIKTVNKNK